MEQLAAYLQKAVSSPFRVRVSSARMFGITKNEKGQVHLTELGRMIADPKTEPAARAEAFLSVELYKAIFEKYRKFTLPGTSGLESEMQALGVSSKHRRLGIRTVPAGGTGPYCSKMDHPHRQ